MNDSENIGMVLGLEKWSQMVTKKDKVIKSYGGGTTKGPHSSHTTQLHIFGVPQPYGNHDEESRMTASSNYQQTII